MAVARSSITPWIPVALWALLVVGGLGGESFKQESTEGFFVPILERLFPDLAPWEIRRMHRRIRHSAHAVEYGVAAFLVYRAFSLSLAARGQRPGRAALALRTLALVAALATVDEVRQGFLPGRSGEASDVVLDMTGALLALPLGVWWMGRGRREERPGDG